MPQDKIEAVKNVAEAATNIRQSMPVSPEELGFLKSISYIFFSVAGAILDISLTVITSKEDITEIVQHKTWRVLSFFKLISFLAIGVMVSFLAYTFPEVRDGWWLIAIGAVSVISLSKASMVATRLVYRAEGEAGNAFSRWINGLVDKSIESRIKEIDKKKEN